MTTNSPWRRLSHAGSIHRCLAIFAFGLLLFIPGVRVYAADGSPWQPIGPDSGASGEILVHPTDPDRVFIIGEQGIFRSDDGGEQWRALYTERDWDNPFVNVVLHPTDPDRLYALFRRGTYRYELELLASRDGGETWQLQFSVPANDDVFGWNTSLAIAPSAPETLYLFARRQMFKSEDGGASWTQLALSGHELTSINIAPSDADVIFAPVVGGQDLPAMVLRSEDGGAQWISLDAPADGHVRSLTIHPTDPDTLFVGSLDGFSTSRDGGRSWTQSGQNSQVWDIRISPTTPLIMYAIIGGALFKSEDEGANWRKVDTSGLDAGRPWIADFAIHPTDPETLFINQEVYYPFGNSRFSGSSSILYKSTDGGDGWRLLDQGLPNNALTDFAFSPQTGALYAVGGPGAFRRAPDEQVWTSINNGLGESPPMIHQLAVSPETPETPEMLYIIADSLNGDNPAAYKSPDEGASWTLTAANVSSGPPKEMIIASANPMAIYLVDAAGVILKSVDGGVTWPVLDAGPSDVREIAADPTNPARLYATSATDGGALWRSDNGGAAWETLSLPAIAEQFVDLSPLAVDPEGVVYIRQGWFGPLLRSEDHGESWEALDALPLRAILHAVAFDPAAPDKIIIATDIGISISNDSGDSWRTGGQPISRRYPTMQVAIDPMDAQHLVVMNDWGGLYAREFVTRHAYLPLTGAALDDEHSGQIDPTRSGAWVQSARLDPTSGARIVVQPRQLVTGLGNAQYWAGPESVPATARIFVVIALGTNQVGCIDFPFYDRNTPIHSFPGETEEYALSFIAPDAVGHYKLTATVVTDETESHDSPCTSDGEWQSIAAPSNTRTIGEIVVRE